MHPPPPQLNIEGNGFCCEIWSGSASSGSMGMIGASAGIIAGVGGLTVAMAVAIVLLVTWGITAK